MAIRDMVLLAGIGVACGLGGYGLRLSRQAVPDAADAGGVVPLARDTQSGWRESLIDTGDLSATPEPVRAAVASGAEALAAWDFKAMFARLGEIPDAGERQQALLELLGRFDAAQMGQLFTLIAEGGIEETGADFGDSGILTMFALVDRWVELDVEAAAGFALSGLDDEIAEGIISILTAAFIAQRDIGRARQLYEDMRRLKPDLDDDFNAIIYIGAAFDDPAKAMRMYREEGGTGDEDIDPLFEIAGVRAGEMLGEVLALPPGGNRGGLIEELFDGWSKADPQAALLGAAGLSPGDRRDKVLKDVLREYAGRDPKGALAQLDLLPPDHRERSARMIVETWSQRDATAALGWARENLEPAAVGELLLTAQENVDPALAVELLAGLGEEERGRFLESSRFTDGGHFVQRWAHADPVGAVGWLRDNGLLASTPEEGEVAPSAPLRLGTIAEDRGAGHRMARAAVAQGVVGAQEIFATLPEGEFRDGFLAGVAFEYARDDPAAAAGWAAGLDADVREVAQLRVTEGWAAVDPVAAGEWALGSNSEQGVESVLRSWSRSDPEEAYRWLVGELAGEPERVATASQMSNLLNEWAVRDPASAAEAMLGFPEDLASGQMATVTGRWAAAEPMAASAFIEARLDPGPVRDAAVGALVERIKRDDLPSAMAWARTISDEAARYALMDSLATE